MPSDTWWDSKWIKRDLADPIHILSNIRTLGSSPFQQERCPVFDQRILFVGEGVS
jgi:hypothetical protein